MGGDAIASRYNIGPGMTRYLNATLGRLREGDFSIEGALDAWNALNSHLYGFTLQELKTPLEAEESSDVSAYVLPSSRPRTTPRAPRSSATSSHTVAAKTPRSGWT